MNKSTSSRLFGYARVSTLEQKEDRQIDALTEYGIPQAMIFVEKQSGKNSERPVYQSMVKRLRAGDVVVIKSLDRLGRNYREIRVQWTRITKEIGADIVVLDMPILDTRVYKDLIGMLITDLVLDLLSYVSQNEREQTLTRQAEGIRAAKARGTRFGRAPKDRGEAYEALAESWRNKEISAREAGRQLGVSHATFLRWAREGEDM